MTRYKVWFGHINTWAEEVEAENENDAKSIAATRVKLEEMLYVIDVERVTPVSELKKKLVTVLGVDEVKP